MVKAQESEVTAEKYESGILQTSLPVWMILVDLNIGLATAYHLAQSRQAWGTLYLAIQLFSCKYVTTKLS